MSCCDDTGHHCNQGRACPQRTAKRTTERTTARPERPQRTCAALGVCQHRAPPCAGCTPGRYYFAPGTIEGGPSARQTHALMRWTLMCAALMASTAVVCFAAGYLA